MTTDYYLPLNFHKETTMTNNKYISVLIVEDEFLASEYLKDILLKLGFINIFSSKNALDAIEIVKNHNISLVFMDINISGNIDGITCAKLINEICLIPIIYTTAYVDDETISEANETNIYGYVMKPFHLKDVQSILTVALKFINKNSVQIIDENFLNNDLENKINLPNSYTYYPDTKIIKYYSNTVNLTKRESVIIDLLIRNLNQVVSYKSLMLNVWENKTIASSTIRDAVSRLKKKLPYLDVQNISNLGYCLKA